MSCSKNASPPQPMASLSSKENGHDENNNCITTNNDNDNNKYMACAVDAEKSANGISIEWNIEASSFAKLTCNPVRKIIEQMRIEPNPNLPMIALSIGDPTIFSHIAKPDAVIAAIKSCIDDKRHDGYTPSYGTDAARRSIAAYYSKSDAQLVYKHTDIILTSGCSQALDLCITVLADRGQNILLPKPGFSIYKTLCGTLGIDVKYYNLLENKNWEIDLVELESAIDDQTVAIIVNNPSNPCGSVYSRQHLSDIIAIAERYRLPIIADEVYGQMVFPGSDFAYMSEISKSVPILSCNALSKRFILPGWRFGWIAIHDPQNHLPKVRVGLNDLTTRILGPNSLVQAAIPSILENTPQSYYSNIMEILSLNASIVYERLSQLKGLVPKKSSGAMYLMIGLELKHFPGIKNDLDFATLLCNEQSVFCLPGSIFEAPNYIRVVITMHKEKIAEACDRIEKFVADHYREENIDNAYISSATDNASASPLVSSEVNDVEMK